METITKMNDLTLDDELGLLWHEYTQTGDEEELAEYERLRKFQQIWKENFKIF